MEQCSVCQVMEADSPSLKRSFDSVKDPGTYHYCEFSQVGDGEPLAVRSTEPTSRRGRPLKRRSTSTFRSPAMPIQTSTPVPAAFPSFMSVFGGGMGTLQDDMREDTLPNDSRGRKEFLSDKTTQTHYPIPPRYKHRKSAASINSDSTDSSPTTIVSTFDSPSMTDPSPSSSPESPISLLPLSSFRPKMGTQRQHEITSQTAMLFPAEPRAESPASKERNVKNLSLNMNVRPSTPSAVEGPHAFSAPTSPLRGPLKTGRRRPNNLTIQTPGFDKTSFPACEIPPTPSNRPVLKHHESSPALPSLLSPTTAPLAGMQLPPLSVNRLLSRPGSESSFSSLSVSSQGLQDLKEEAAEINQPLKSQEAQERGYPDGPIVIYDSGVYLYLEPSVEEASKFDTIINVAKEVANPFANPASDTQSSMVSLWRSSEHQDYPEPQTALSDGSFKSAFEWPQVMWPTSPATPLVKSSAPEYIHVPWDHNSEILDDLYSLCQIIDTRLSNGKSVLVHCQLGVSRSASLVIAYGLYKGYKTDFHSMYTSVKERSRWVGPNMSLIYQLMDFRTKIANGEYAAASKPPSQAWFMNAGTEHEMTPRPLPVTRATSPDAPQPSETTGPVGSLTSSKSSLALSRPAPLEPTVDTPHPASRKISLPTALSNINLSSPAAMSSIASSPVSFPALAPPIPPKSTKRGAPRPLPLRERVHPSMHILEIPPHTPRAVSHDASSAQVIAYAPIKMDLMMQDAPTPSIFSPRTTEFMTISLGPTTAGDLATANIRRKPGHSKRMSVFSPPQTSLPIDPRSPHQANGNAEILSYIDDVL